MIRFRHLYWLLPAMLPAVSLAEESLADLIDREVRAAWEEQQIEPAPPAEDAAFLRRIYLDLCGVIPDYQETVAFLADEDVARREKLIDRLLDDPRYARHQADVWDLLLFGRDPANSEARNRAGFQRWLREQFAANTPYDKMVEAMLKAEGNTVDDGAPMFLLQFRGRPEDAAVAVTQNFLGIQLQCARCHDHPFESWTQLDFYGLAAFFARLQSVSIGKQGSDTKYVIAEKRTGEVLFTGPASEQTPGKEGEPVGARFLQGEPLEEPPLPAGFEEPRNFPSGKVPPAPDFSRKDRLAEWVVSTDNPYFAKAAVNRIWAQFMGRGLVHPVDNMSPANSASHPALLAGMAEQFVAHQFDVKWLIREIVCSEAYQLSAEGPVEAARPKWFERAKVRPLSAEELADSWRIATGYDAASSKQPKEGERFFGVTEGYMLRYFGQPLDGVGDFQGGLQEHLYLNNGQVTGLISTGKGGLVDAILSADAGWSARVDRLFLSVLSRPPRPEEAERFAAYLDAENEREQSDRLREAIWTLMTASEFRFCY